MRRTIRQALATAGFFCVLFGPATSTQAALIDRGGGLIHDTPLNITWLQDARENAAELALRLQATRGR